RQPFERRCSSALVLRCDPKRVGAVSRLQSRCVESPVEYPQLDPQRSGSNGRNEGAKLSKPSRAERPVSVKRQSAQNILVWHEIFSTAIGVLPGPSFVRRRSISYL